MSLTNVTYSGLVTAYPFTKQQLARIPPHSYNSTISLWNQIIGHEQAVELLSGTIRRDRVSHVQLIGRTFIQALNCQHNIVVVTAVNA